MKLFRKKCKHADSKVTYISHPSDAFYKKTCNTCGKVTTHGSTRQEKRVYDFLINMVIDGDEYYTSIYQKIK